MKVTVAICTWNRADLLNQTLSKMRELHVPDDVEWELLIVNNKCTDSTDEVIARYSDALPICRLFESKPGLSNARNCAIDHANGDLLLWTDDDVLVEKDWLHAYICAAKNWPDVSFFGGTVNPWFENTPPKWVSMHLHQLQGTYAIRQLGDSVRLFQEGEAPFGANMAFRTSTQKAYRYNQALGRSGTNMISGEESSLFKDMRRDGHQGLWVGTAVVQHFIPSDRLTAQYISAYFSGISRTRVRQTGTPDLPTLFGMPRHWVRKYLKCLFLSLLNSPWRNEDWLKAMKQKSIVQGMFHELRAIKLNPKNNVAQ